MLRYSLKKSATDLYEYAGRNWLEIDLDKLDHNYLTIKSLLPEDTEIIPVIKADAYGHGALDIARVLNDLDTIPCFAVACLDEALFLRHNGINNKILLLSSNEMERYKEGIAEDFIFALPNLVVAKALDSAAKALGKKANVHIALDTGLGRLGFRTNREDSLEQVLKLKDFPNLNITGIYSHYATATGMDYSQAEPSESLADEFYELQTKRFVNFTERLEAEGMQFKTKHISNSSGLFAHHNTAFSAIRPGLSLYGVNSSENMGDTGLEPIMSWKTRVFDIKRLKAGESVSYERHFVAKKDTLVAVLPVGFADGYDRTLINKAKVLYKGKICPVLGIISMDMIMVDITKVGKEAKIGDEVTLMQDEAGKDKLNVYTLAKWRNVNYSSIFVGISKRVPKIYKRGNKYLELVKYLN